MCASERLTRSRSAARAQRGLSLVEIMVGMVIALLVSLAASGSASVFTASQRQGIGAGGMTVNSGSAPNRRLSIAAFGRARQPRRRLRTRF